MAYPDRSGSGSNPPLSPAGQIRANLSRDMLQDQELGAVFVTDTLRSTQTGQPTATAKGLTLTTYGAEDSAALVETIRVNHAGQTVLVVAHANTVDDIAGALGMPGVGELADSQFDRSAAHASHGFATALQHPEPGPGPQAAAGSADGGRASLRPGCG
jgi:broad specificity phosphatase PhoE